MSLKIVFCWSDISGYMAACWRSLQARQEIDLFVIAFQARTQTAFSDGLMQGIPCRLLGLQERNDTKLIKELISQQNPDAIVLCGWFHHPYRQLAFAKNLQNIPLIMGMDTPWWGNWKQHLAPWILRSYLKQMAHVVVTGERSWQYAYRLGIPLENISLGLYGIDYEAYAPLLAARRRSPWPRSFLFVGRYSHDKAIDLLATAYRLYRSQVGDPWDLVCCGQGDLESHLQDQVGITNRGFVQPAAMTDIWLKAGALVLPSRFDPWPIALVEAAAAGLAIICTQVCGSAVEVIRSEYNGIIIPPDRPEALAASLLTIHNHYNELAIWGTRSQDLAQPYRSEIWAQRWLAIFNSVLHPVH
ncbi:MULTISPECIES: glycosyltransferase family 4 protein [Pseudanabaena]|uniref:Glycosyl transferase group 1 n=2 Tax=Pseudanabaena TaxID=1152 RepID=L8MWH8_9CYAN|nr:MULTISPECIES: glycosyltransferase family 4 protein [Pseudanabaena]ELS32332.1 glycosyl transferase group 1 [Pseudanabaena biceps PCC 7429]MDG3495424.1 glycosyltransferase family 4 protein [Pseudanabaena catenata USMAC16]